MPGSTDTPGVVVVGGGQAGCQFVSSVRDEGYSGEIVLLSAESHLPYQRPPLSKGHLTGKAPRENLWLRPEPWFAEHGVDLRLGVRATALTLEPELEVVADDGSVFRPGTVVLALGSRHRPLPVPGTELEGVVGLRTLDEADGVRGRLEAASNVVIVGGGFIGMEVAATAAALGKKATVVEMADQLMGRVLSADTADFLLHAHRSRGLEIRLATTSTRLVGQDGTVVAVETSDGARLDADLVLLGVGAVPEIDLAAAAGLAVDNGIVVDEHLRTSDPRVLAIGDCVSAPNPFLGGRHTRLESVQNAVSQGRTAAAGVAGKPAVFDAVPWFWSDQADLKLQIAGLTTGHHEVVLVGDVEAEKFSAYCFLNGRLLGVESVNRPGDHLAARRILERRIALTPEQVRAPDFEVKKASAG